MLETSVVSLGAVPRSWSSSCGTLHHSLNDRTELSKPLTSFKRRIYLRLNVGISLGSGKIRDLLWETLLNNLPFVLWSTKLYFDTSHKMFSLEILKYLLEFHGLEFLNGTRAVTISANVSNAYIPERYKVFLPYNLIFHFITLLCWTSCSAIFSSLGKKLNLCNKQIFSH